MSNDFANTEAFKELLRVVEQTFGPIDFYTVCDPQIPLIDEGDEEVLAFDASMASWADHAPKITASVDELKATMNSLAQCSCCEEWRWKDECDVVDVRVGEDLTEEPVYICFDCLDGTICILTERHAQ